MIQYIYLYSKSFVILNRPNLAPLFKIFNKNCKEIYLSNSKIDCQIGNDLVNTVLNISSQPMNRENLGNEVAKP